MLHYVRTKWLKGGGELWVAVNNVCNCVAVNNVCSYVTVIYVFIFVKFCFPFDLQGVLVTRGTASPTVALPLREGSGRQSVQIDVMYSAAVDYASIFGQNLWQIIVFASSHPNGQELIGGAVTGMLGNNGVNLPLIAGRSTVFSVSAVLDLGDTYQTCSELQYVCGTLNRDPTTQAFGFVGQPPSATTACARFECIGKS